MVQLLWMIAYWINHIAILGVYKIQLMIFQVNEIAIHDYKSQILLLGATVVDLE